MAALALSLGLLASPAFAAEQIKFEIPPFPSVFPVGSCDTFDVISESTINLRVIEHYDNAGNLKSANVRVVTTDSIYYNSAVPEIFLVGGPNQSENALFDFRADPPTRTSTGVPFKVIVPGHGIIFHQGGRTLFNNDTDEIIFSAGPSDLVDQDLEALCDALTP
jgi:hypothetical protein